jgi:hypothetical protein
MTDYGLPRKVVVASCKKHDVIYSVYEHATEKVYFVTVTLIVDRIDCLCSCSSLINHSLLLPLSLIVVVVLVVVHDTLSFVTVTLVS